MRITFVLPPDTVSGGIKVALIHARALAKKGHDVRIVSPPAPRLSAVQKARRFVKGEGWIDDLPPAPLALEGTSISHRILDRYRPVVDSDIADGDVVVATWFETAHWVNALGPSKGAKVHLVQHHEIFDYLPADFCRASYRLPLHKVAVSRWLKETMAAEYGDRAVDLVPNSVDREQFFAPARTSRSVRRLGSCTPPFRSRASIPRWRRCASSRRTCPTCASSRSEASGSRLTFHCRLDPISIVARRRTGFARSTPDATFGSPPAGARVSICRPSRPWPAVPPSCRRGQAGRRRRSSPRRMVYWPTSTTDRRWPRRWSGY